MHARPLTIFWALALAAGCQDATTSGEDSALTSADELREATQGFADGSEAETIANLNLRSGPGVEYPILRTLAASTTVEILRGTPEHGFVAIAHAGLNGYVSAAYLRVHLENTDQRAQILNVARGEVGLSYWSGHARLTGGAVTAGNRGSCTGAGHRGAYGTDCAGLLAKAWAVPASNQSLTVDRHPYVSGDFYNGTGGGQWSSISKSEIQPGDALVYRKNGSGYATIYERGDAWGDAWVFEPRGCSYGVVHNIRSTGSASYKAVRKHGL